MKMELVMLKKLLKNVLEKICMKLCLQVIQENNGNK